MATTSVYRCTHCGSMNRVPDPLPSGTPKCGKCKEVLETDGTPQDVTDANFADAVASSPVPVVVDFWAPWCGPCRTAAPILDGLARAKAGKALFLKLNTDDNPATAGRFEISGIPSFYVFKGGNVVAHQSGLPPKAAFEKWVTDATGV